MERELLNRAGKGSLFGHPCGRTTLAALYSLLPLLFILARPCMAYDMGANSGNHVEPRLVAAQNDNGAKTDTGDDFPEEPGTDDLLNETGLPGNAAQVHPAETKRLPFHYEGELRSSVLVPTSEDTVHSISRLDLKSWGSIGNVNLQGRVKFDYQDLEESGKFRTDLRELYGQYRFRAGGRYANISLGKKMVSWGKGDEVRPLDRVSAQDLTSLYFYDIAERKTGRLGAFLDIDLYKNLRFEGFWSPFFEASRTPGTGAYFEPAALRKLTDNGIAVDGDIEPERWSTDAGFGGRLMFSLFKADIDLYAFQGYDPNPTYVVNQLGLVPGYNLPMIPQSVVATYPRMTLYGADMERAVGPYVIRAEVAYQPDGAFFTLDWQHNPSLLLEHPDGVIEKRQLQYLVGLDKSDFLVHNLLLNLQFFGGYIFDHDSDMLTSASQTGMTGTLRYSCLDSKVEIKYRVMYVFDNGDQRHHLEVAHKVTSWAQVAVGYIWFAGENDSPYFGQYANLDYVYGQLRLVF